MDKERYELIRRIASVVAHELRNPLAVINNSAYFVKTKLGMSAEKDPKVEKHLGIIASEIARADRMISDMLAFSRPLEIKTGKVALSAVVEEALRACSVPDAVKVKRAGAKTVPEARVLADALRRVMDNAVEAMAGPGTMTVSLGTEGGQVFMEVRDTGPGIKPEALASVAQPFFTTKPRGLGLGLAVADKVMTAHGGRLEAKNLPGAGAAVVLSVPQASA
ncbi:MAG: ATP-binding protein [Elusimicrobiota bacterium]|jgi:signal transduction histidine kinase